jgi:succinate dehydrogenase hydrophobic anchor subunit
MIKYLEFLFYRYYKFQVRVGNSDIAPFSAMLIIVSTIMLYYFGVFFLTIVLIPKDILNFDTTYFAIASVGLLIFLMITLYLLLIHKSKYKKIIKEHEKNTVSKKGIAPLLFFLIGFVLLLGSMFLKVLQNQGKI